MHAPPTVKRNFIALLSETAEEAHPSRPAPHNPLTKGVLALIALIWRRARRAS